MKAYGGSRGLAPLIPNPGTRWRSVINFMLWPFYPLEITYGIRRLGGWVEQKVVLDVREKRKIPSKYGDSNLGPPST
jgi:hypothetical protein